MIRSSPLPIASCSLDFYAQLPRQGPGSRLPHSHAEIHMVPGTPECALRGKLGVYTTGDHPGGGQWMWSTGDGDVSFEVRGCGRQGQSLLMGRVGSSRSGGRPLAHPHPWVQGPAGRCAVSVRLRGFTVVRAPLASIAAVSLTEGGSSPGTALFLHDAGPTRAPLAGHRPCLVAAWVDGPPGVLDVILQSLAADGVGVTRSVVELRPRAATTDAPTAAGAPSQPTPAPAGDPSQPTPAPAGALVQPRPPSTTSRPPSTPTEGPSQQPRARGLFPAQGHAGWDLHPRKRQATSGPDSEPPAAHGPAVAAHVAPDQGATDDPGLRGGGAPEATAILGRWLSDPAFARLVEELTERWKDAILRAAERTQDS